MDYNLAAKKVIEGLGGRENIVSAAHCATRLRLVIGDNDKCNKEFIENIDGVKGVFFASGQLQVIFGTGVVNKVYAEFIKEAGISEASKEDVKQAASAKTNIFKRIIKSLGDVFVPIIPAIVASGLLMGLLEGLCNAFPEMANSGTYQIIHLFSNAAFVFLPVLIGMSAAQVFGGNKFLGAVIGMIMIHPDLLNAWNVAGAESIPQASVWFGAYSINMVGYQGHVIPVVISVWFMSNLEKRLHKIVPEMIDLFVTPLVTVLVTGYLTLTIFGPVFSLLENYVLNGVQYLIAIPFGIGSFIVGAIYAPTVVAGVHHMYNAIEAGMISSTGANIWMPIATAANVAQGAAALALALKTRNRKVKSMALPASLSAFLGITEPAIFGVNLRFFKPFIAGCIGGAFGALAASVLNVSATAYGITGVFGLLITTHCILQYIIVMAVAFAVAFIVSWILYKDNKEEAATEAETENTPEFVPEAGAVYSPLKGEAIPLKEVKDETFAGEVLGQGIAIIPEKGVAVSPVNGKVETLFDTKHAIGITADDGTELLIHIGINTVELGGKHYTAFVSEGDEIKIGQKLIEFDIEEIKKAGYDITTPVIVTNSFDYENILPEKKGNVEYGEKILTVR